jgi:hypothetical protein
MKERKDLTDIFDEPYDSKYKFFITIIIINCGSGGNSSKFNN